MNDPFPIFLAVFPIRLEKLKYRFLHLSLKTCLEPSINVFNCYRKKPS